MSTSIYDTLLELPLFRGASRERLSEIVGVAKFHFLKYVPGDTIFAAGENCTHIRFVLTGKVRVTLESPGEDFEVTQTLDGPDVILPDYLFGRSTVYPARAEALTNLSVLQIEKADYLRILAMDQVFLINYLNYLSMDAQKLLSVMSLPGAGVESRIVFLVNSMTQPGASDIEIISRGKTFEDIFCSDAKSLAEALHRMERADKLTCNKQTIKIKDRRALLGT